MAQSPKSHEVSVSVFWLDMFPRLSHEPHTMPASEASKEHSMVITGSNLNVNVKLLPYMLNVHVYMYMCVQSY